MSTSSPRRTSAVQRSASKLAALAFVLKACTCLCAQTGPAAYSNASEPGPRPRFLPTTDTGNAAQDPANDPSMMMQVEVPTPRPTARPVQASQYNTEAPSRYTTESAPSYAPAASSRNAVDRSPRYTPEPTPRYTPAPTSRYAAEPGATPAPSKAAAQAPVRTERRPAAPTSYAPEPAAEYAPAPRKAAPALLSDQPSPATSTRTAPMGSYAAPSAPRYAGSPAASNAAQAPAAPSYVPPTSRFAAEPAAEPVAAAAPAAIPAYQRPAATEIRRERPKVQPTSSGQIVFEDNQAGLDAVPAAPSPLIVSPEPDAEPDAFMLLRAKRYSELEVLGMRQRDSKLAGAIAWSYYNDNQNDASEKWFGRALQWKETNYEAAYGLALTYFRTKKYKEAEELARWRLSEYPDMRNILGDLVALRAVAAYQAGQDAACMALLDETNSYRPLSRNEANLYAWSLFNAGDQDAAMREFESLYAAQPDSFAAQGLYASCARTNNWERLDAMVKYYGGPLGDFQRQHLARAAYDRGLRLKAAALNQQNINAALAAGAPPIPADEAIAQLENITTPSVSLAMETRSKSGETGLNKLQESKLSAIGRIVVKDVNSFEFQVSQTSLDSGTPSVAQMSSKMGSKQLTENLDGAATISALDPTLTPETPVPPVAPKTSYKGLTSFKVRYSHEGDITPFVEVGMSPSGGAIAAAPVGEAGLKIAADRGKFQASVYREANNESVLSSVGLSDPNGAHTKWGGVTETGVRGYVLRAISSNWTFAGEASAGMLSGTNVEDNTHLKFRPGVSRELKVPGFQYFTVGPVLNVEQYEKDLSGFTFGKGGYFSPQMLTELAAQSRFMSKEGSSLLWKGGGSLGYEMFTVDSGPLYPTDAPSPKTEGYDHNAFVGRIDVDMLWLLSNRWGLGAKLSASNSSDYTEYKGGFYVQYFFDKRSGLFESDFLRF